MGNPIYSLSGLMYDYGDDDINGWTGYTTPTYVKEWYFIDNVPMGYVEALTIHPSQVPNQFTGHFARSTFGGFDSLDEAKAAFEERLITWFVKRTETLPNLP